MTGLGIARRIAHITYRSELELHERFGREPQGGEDPSVGGGRYAVECYLDHHAGKLRGRFDANSYVVLTEAMNSHDVGRGRGGVRAALAGSPPLVVVAASTRTGSTRRGCPRRSPQQPRAPSTHTITSAYGHDGFLIEIDQVGRIVRRGRWARPA